MKVLLINGSPHPKGCTYRALSEVEKTLRIEGIETEWLQAGPHPVRGCMGCGMCRKNKLGKCIFGEDNVNVAIARMEECDGLIVGSPVHYAAASGAVTSFLDRMFYSSNGFPYKPGAAVVSCRRAGSTAALEQLNKYFMMSNMPLVPSAYWNMVHGNSPEEVEQDLEGMMVMRTLGRNMAWMLKSIEAGQKNGLLPPKPEKKTRTNFIRKIESQEDQLKNYSPYFNSYNKVNKEFKDED
ncbi:MAG: flavodoxin family protein [Eubacterium sp.]|nr:flavodoxin family protein [Eubacterium sp.]MDD7208722.1 flavodoxin family protein [Lachnospiraceae bacterium]MDY5497749.1 flavodoxin family protein [Anaerobutyricum sp.]